MTALNPLCINFPVACIKRMKILVFVAMLLVNSNPIQVRVIVLQLSVTLSGGQPDPEN